MENVKLMKTYKTNKLGMTLIFRTKFVQRPLFIELHVQVVYMYTTKLDQSMYQHH